MALKKDLAGSARRHLSAANDLYDIPAPGRAPGNKAIAGYLYGLAGELALKEMMHQSGMRPLPAEDRRSDPFYAHFPTLKTLLLDRISGRRDGELRAIAEQPELFQNWSTELRYAATSEIKPGWTDLWKTHAETLVDRMNL